MLKNGLVILFSLISFNAHAQGRLEVRFITLSELSGDGFIELELANVGDKGIVLPLSIPLADSDGWIDGDWLDVRDAHGRRARYLGRVVEFAGGGKMPVLKPREKMTSKLNLPRLYELQPGQAYEVRLRGTGQMSYWDEAAMDVARSTEPFVEPLRLRADVAPVTLWINPR